MNGYEVIKLGTPRMAIGIRHMGSHLLIDRKLNGKADAPERLDFVVNDDETVFLRTAAERILDLPEETARYFLAPIVDLLKGEATNFQLYRKRVV